MPFQLSPGVAVVEKDFSSIVPAVSSSVGAFAGSFAWGPVMQPITVSSENVLVQQFGKPNDSNFQSFLSAANFLSYANNLLLVRTDSTNGKNAVATKTGGLSTLSISNAGSGYTSTAAAPHVTIGAPDIEGGTQAEATVTLSGGTISAIAVADGGLGYTVGGYGGIAIAISAPGGSGVTATAHATVDGSGTITAIVIDTAGSGYKAAPTVTITGTHTGASATAGTVTITGSTITGITIVEAGSGYDAMPAISIAAPPSGVTATAIGDVSLEGGVKIMNSEDYLSAYVNGGGVVGEFAAKYPGSLGNSITVAYADADTFDTWAYKASFDSAPGTSAYATGVNGTNDEMHFIIIDRAGAWTGVPGSVLEKFAFVSKASDARRTDGTNNYYKNVINTNSAYIWWMDKPISGHDDWGTTAVETDFTSLAEAALFNLSGGVDDYTMTPGQQQDAYALFSNAELYDVSLMFAGKADAETAAMIADIAQARADAVAFVSPEDVSSGDPIIGNTSASTDKVIAYRNSMNTIHSYAVMDSGYKYQYDRYNDKYRWVPLNADTAGLCARTDNTNDPWWSPGGFNRGTVKNVVKLAFNPDQAARDTLYKAGVNPVVSFPGQGIVLYGDKTLQTKPSAFDRINVRRLFIVLEKAIATAAKFQLFEFNDGFTRAQFKNLVEPFLRDVQGRRGIVDFRVKCDDTNNTGAVIDANQFVADIFIKPNRSINFITLNFVAARSSANFTEIGG
jgi:phage tail sheath protein FI